MQPRRFLISNILNKNIVFSLSLLSRLQFLCLFSHCLFRPENMIKFKQQEPMFRQLLTFRSATVQKNPAQVFWSQQKIFPTFVCSRVWVQQPLRAQPPPQRALARKQLRLSSALVCRNNLSGWCQWTSMGLNFPAVTTIITSVLHVLASTWCTSYCCVGPSHHTNWTIVLLVHCVICASSFACLDVQSVWTSVTNRSTRLSLFGTKGGKYFVGQTIWAWMK